MKEQGPRANGNGCLPCPHAVDRMDDPPWSLDRRVFTDFVARLLCNLHGHHTLWMPVQEHGASRRNCGHPAQEPGGHNTTDDAVHRRSGALVAAAVGQAEESDQQTRDATRCGNG